MEQNSGIVSKQNWISLCDGCRNVVVLALGSNGHLLFGSEKDSFTLRIIRATPI
jgi:hypothetical protein